MNLKNHGWICKLASLALFGGNPSPILQHIRTTEHLVFLASWRLVPGASCTGPFGAATPAYAGTRRSPAPASGCVRPILTVAFFCHALAIALFLAFLPSPTGAQGETDVAASAGLYAVTLNLPQGAITVYFPADLSPGDRISGAITVAPAGEDRKELAFNQAALNGYVLTCAGQQTPATIGWETWTVPPGATSLQLVFTDASGAPQGQAAVPIQPGPSPASSGFEFPAAARAGRPARIAGAFDGSLENTRLRIAAQDAELLAESPRSLLFRTPGSLAGQAAVTLSEGSRTAAGESRIASAYIDLVRYFPDRGAQTLVTQLAAKPAQAASPPAPITPPPTALPPAPPVVTAPPASPPPPVAAAQPPGISYRFYAARKLDLEEAKNLWVDAIHEWTDRIREKCGGTPERVALTDRGDDRSALPELKERFTTRTEGWPSWVLGEDALKEYLNPSTSPRDFHIALFEDIKAQQIDDMKSVNGHYIPPNIMALNAKARDLDRNARIHLVGQLFGLSPGDGGVMSIYYPRGENRPGVYGKLAEWPEGWCARITEHLGK